MGHGDIDGDRGPQRRLMDEQMEGGIYGLSTENNEFFFNITISPFYHLN